MAVFVLVHGSWHGGWCWKRLTPLLRAAGHEVYAPTLAGLGERSHTLSQGIDLETHVMDVVNLMQFEDLKEVILVGHSMGGMVIVGAADASPDRVRHLVYLDAVTPGDGQSLFDCLPEYRDLFRQIAKSVGDGWLVKYPADYGTFGVSDENDVKWLTQRLTSHPLACYEQGVRFRNPSALALPKTFIYCNGNKKVGVKEYWVCLPDSFPAGWGMYEIKTAHDAMITAPQELAKVLVGIAGSQ